MTEPGPPVYLPRSTVMDGTGPSGLTLYACVECGAVVHEQDQTQHTVHHKRVYDMITLLLDHAVDGYACTSPEVDTQ